MPSPFEKPAAPDADHVVRALEKGSRARQLLQLGVGDDLQARRAFIWFQAESELLAGTLTPDRALMHIACSNALRAYRRELEGDVEKAQHAASALHEEEVETETPAS